MLSNRGSTIVQIVVFLGVSGILSLIIGSTVNTGMSSVEHLKSQSGLLNLHSDLRQIFLDKKLCTDALASGNNRLLENRRMPAAIVSPKFDLNMKTRSVLNNYELVIDNAEFKETHFLMSNPFHRDQRILKSTLYVQARPLRPQSGSVQVFRELPAGIVFASVDLSGRVVECFSDRDALPQICESFGGEYNPNTAPFCRFCNDGEVFMGFSKSTLKPNCSVLSEIEESYCQLLGGKFNLNNKPRCFVQPPPPPPQVITVTTTIIHGYR